MSSCGCSSGVTRRRSRTTCEPASLPPFPVEKILPQAAPGLSAKWVKSTTGLDIIEIELAGVKAYLTPSLTKP